MERAKTVRHGAGRPQAGRLAATADTWPDVNISPTDFEFRPLPVPGSSPHIFLRSSRAWRPVATRTLAIFSATPRIGPSWRILSLGRVTPLRAPLCQGPPAPPTPSRGLAQRAPVQHQLRARARARAPMPRWRPHHSQKKRPHLRVTIAGTRTLAKTSRARSDMDITLLPLRLRHQIRRLR